MHARQVSGSVNGLLSNQLRVTMLAMAHGVKCTTLVPLSALVLTVRATAELPGA